MANEEENKGLNPTNENSKIQENIIHPEENELNKKIIIDNSKFEEKATQQVTRLLKDMETLAFHGSKSTLSEELIERIVVEIRDQSNIAKKQFSSNLTEKEFGEVTPHVNKVLKEIKILGELSNKHAGEYEKNHLEKIFESLRKKINETKKGLRFKDKKDNKFSF